ncbi:MAG: 50S ribosomal protein L29 [Candidatus Gracilibacteria bacterium]|nr:50S ribosomal protein L29 [Candidatus Gracilibacteria bacterium]
MKEIKDLNLKELKKLNDLDEKALKAELSTSAKNLYVLSMKKEVGELKQTHLIKALRRYIAQVKTVANTKGLNIG